MAAMAQWFEHPLSQVTQSNLTKYNFSQILLKFLQIFLIICYVLPTSCFTRSHEIEA